MGCSQAPGAYGLLPCLERGHTKFVETSRHLGFGFSFVPHGILLYTCLHTMSWFDGMEAKKKTCINAAPKFSEGTEPAGCGAHAA